MRSSSSVATPCTTRRIVPCTLACRPQKLVTPAAVPMPPRKPWRSISSVDRPARPAATAAAMPAGPPPSTTTSNSPSTGVDRAGSDIVRPEFISLLLCKNVYELLQALAWTGSAGGRGGHRRGPVVGGVLANGEHADRPEERACSKGHERPEEGAGCGED